MSARPASGPVPSDLAGRSVLVTGGGAGIGAAFTRAFAAAGAQVAFVQRSDGTALCDQVEAATGRRPLGLLGDITDAAALRQAIARVTEAHGPVEVLINNAASDMRHQTLTTTDDDWDRLMAINLKASFATARAVLGGMRAAGRGVIINVTSISYMMGNAGYPAYVAANAGLNGMTRALAREFGPDGIRVNSLAPGWVMTDRQRALWVTPEALQDHLARQCIPRALTPEDITGAALFLASDASAMMTGQTLVVDGGVVVTG